MDIGGVPPELTNRPKANVAFCGLDISHNVHNTIWTSFTENRANDREALQFAIHPLDHAFPVAKTKRVSYEGYVERGILKTNWLEKHMKLIPSAGVFFFDLDWDEANFSERKAECAEQLMQFKKNLSGRESRVALVLIQMKPSSPVSDNKVASERAHELTTACEIPLKALFVLQFTDHLLGFIMRLETAIMELCKGYYSGEYRRMAAQSQLLTKGSHQLVFIRHHFKMATFQELKQDPTAAAKHYKQAYTFLAELRATDPNILEVKTVAAIINYKICQLFFDQNAPLDAIHQLRRHIENFKLSVGPPPLAFEHYAWLSKQCSLFGDLFEYAVRKGLSPIQTQHPGFYYSLAAQHSLVRKKVARELCRNATLYPEPDPLSTSIDDLPFYGQRPWRAAVPKGEALDASVEEMAVRALQFKERETNHSNIIIPLLSGAVSQFKKYKGPRIKRQQMVQLAEEYLDNNEHDKALSILMHVLLDYRSERWPRIMQDLLRTALRAAYLAANPGHFLTLAIEYMSTWTDCSPDTRDILLKNVIRVLDCQTPLKPFADLEDTSSLWQEKLQQLKSDPIPLDMDKLKECIDCKAHFTQASYTSDENIQLHVYVRSHLPFNISVVSRFSIHFNHNSYDSQCSITDPRVLSLAARRTQTFTFSFSPNQNHVASQLQVVGVDMLLGSGEGGVKPILKLTWSSLSLGSQFSHLAWEPIPNKLNKEPDFKQLAHRLTASITYRRASMGVEWVHEPPALVNELHPVTLRLTNSEHSDIGNIKVSISTGATPAPSTFFSLDPSSDLVPVLSNVDVPPIRTGSSQELQLFFKCSEVSQTDVEVTINYEISLLVDGQNIICKCNKHHKLKVEVAEVFTSLTSVLNGKFESVPKVRCGEPFVLVIDVTSVTSIPIEIVACTLQLADQVTLADAVQQSQMEGIELDKDEVGRDCYCLVAENPTDSLPLAPSLGTFTLRWRRKTYVHSNDMSFSLPCPTVTSSTIFVSLQSPPFAKVRTPLYVTYNIFNRSTDVQEISLQMNSSDAFMFSGSKQLSLRIPPGGEEALLYNLYPLLAGYVALPRIHLVLSPSTTPVEMDSVVQEMLPSFIFVMPQSKGTRSPS